MLDWLNDVTHVAMLLLVCVSFDFFSLSQMMASLVIFINEVIILNENYSFI